ncbi:MAG: PHP domain-containing protein [Candidatus Aminicenantes bacterium]|nr:PHP domain-containing protein [Candidatus Aminicenantes bacterium]
MSGTVDLHIHSDRSSDGTYPPAELVRLAAANGFAAISIADHDTVAAYPEAIEASAGSGVEVIPSMEVTTLFDEREFHLLLPFADWASPIIGRIGERVSKGRLIEARERVEKLRGLGLDITWEEVEAATRSTPPLGVTIAQILLDKPGSKDDPALKKYYEGEALQWAPYHFYRDYFLEGKPAFVTKRHIALLEVLEMAPQAKAVPVLAHPGAYFENATRDDLVRLKERGLAGLEVYTSYHQPEQTAFYADLAKALDLVPTAGSDFHGRIKPHVYFGYIKDGGVWMVEELRKRRR